MKAELKRALTPFQAFVQSESSGGILLLVAAVSAFIWANSPWADTYEAVKHFPITIGWSSRFSLHESLFHWTNDGLMVFFFLLVGLEIKREVRGGELSNVRAAALPVLAALGGMVAPALIFVGITRGGPGIQGWAIPMATDIAFALGILALLGKRIPQGLRVFLTALAIADDLGAVVIIAVFYSQDLNWTALGAVVLLWAGALAYGFRGGRWLTVYGALGVVLWFFMLRSGVHATIAGILLALALPMTSPTGDRARAAPLQRLEHLLQPWVSYFIVPLFAFLNAGFGLRNEAGITEPIILGAFLGLFIGKPLGVTGVSWLAIKLRLADLPPATTWRHLWGASALAGIGFTMSLFLGDLAFRAPHFQDYAKLGILTASVASACAGVLILLSAKPAPRPHDG